MSSEEIKKAAYKYAIKNAYLHDGKASEKAVVGKLKALFPELDIKDAIKLAKEIVEEVNSKEFSKIEEEYKKFEAEGFELKPKEKTEPLPELPWAKYQKVVTRFAPNPNGPMHLGHARAAILSDEYAKRYNGRFILRFDDTDPKLKIPMENAEEIFKKDLKWLKCKVSATYFASKRLNIYKRYMKKLVEKGRAYVCTCNAEEWREKIKKQMPCKCRNKKPALHLKRLEKMFKHKYKEGEAVLRLKTSLSHPDPSVRDWWLARIVDEPKHPFVKDEHVWPSYNFASAIDDHLLGVTLIIRGQEHAQNEVKQRFLYNYFGWEYPHTIYTGRVMLEGVTLSTSKIGEAIKKGIYSGWDDPRLGTIMALRRRGFLAETIREIILDIGVKPNDSTIQWKTLEALNRKHLSNIAPRINALFKPVKLIVEFPPEKEVEYGGKKIQLNPGLQDFYIDRTFVEEEGQILRLRNAYNVRIKKITAIGIFAEFAGDNKIEPIVSWILKPIKTNVLMPDASKKEMYLDSELEMKEGKIYYVNGLGFVRVDKTLENEVLAIFAHK